MSSIRHKHLLAGATVLVVSALAIGAGGAREGNSSNKAYFEKLKGLAGSWAGQMGHGDEKSESTTTYRVTAAGSAVMEAMFEGSEHEMITMYHMDGDDLILTHYCSMGNQPSMKALAGTKADTVRFECIGGRNMKSENDAHMHALTIEFVDSDHIRAAWTMNADGKEGSVAHFDMKRKKQPKS
jgi:hypothetical protein